MLSFLFAEVISKTASIWLTNAFFLAFIITQFKAKPYVSKAFNMLEIVTLLSIQFILIQLAFTIEGDEINPKSH